MKIQHHMMVMEQNFAATSSDFSLPHEEYVVEEWQWWRILWQKIWRQWMSCDLVLTYFKYRVVLFIIILTIYCVSQQTCYID